MNETVGEAARNHEAFERWMRERIGNSQFERSMMQGESTFRLDADGNYASPFTAMLWKTWRAGAAHQARFEVENTFVNINLSRSVHAKKPVIVRAIAFDKDGKLDAVHEHYSVDIPNLVHNAVRRASARILGIRQ